MGRFLAAGRQPLGSRAAPGRGLEPALRQPGLGLHPALAAGRLGSRSGSTGPDAPPDLRPAGQRPRQDNLRKSPGPRPACAPGAGAGSIRSALGGTLWRTGSHGPAGAAWPAEHACGRPAGSEAGRCALGAGRDRNLFRDFETPPLGPGARGFLARAKRPGRSAAAAAERSSQPAQPQLGLRLSGGILRGANLLLLRSAGAVAQGPSFPVDSAAGALEARAAHQDPDRHGQDCGQEHGEGQDQDLHGAIIGQIGRSIEDRARVGRGGQPGTPRGRAGARAAMRSAGPQRASGRAAANPLRPRVPRAPPGTPGRVDPPGQQPGAAAGLALPGCCLPGRCRADPWDRGGGGPRCPRRRGTGAKRPAGNGQIALPAERSERAAGG